ncbi:MAG: hypothetical protein GY777_28790 [Candidatus Brocadiaceae bacterium]|nr:hypothetical protein [Candidatus Brocadiaceae bacterium]
MPKAKKLEYAFSLSEMAVTAQLFFKKRRIYRVTLCKFLDATKAQVAYQ